MLDALVVEQPHLGGYAVAAAVARDALVAGEHAMAGHDDGDRIGADGSADRSSRGCATGGVADLAVRDDRAEGELAKFVPHCALEIRSDEAHGNVEVSTGACEVFIELLDGGVEYVVGVLRGTIPGQASLSFDRERRDGRGIRPDLDASDGGVDAAVVLALFGRGKTAGVDGRWRIGA